MSIINSKKILIFNSSPSGKDGNCSLFIQSLIFLDIPDVQYSIVHLSETQYSAQMRNEIAQADGLIFVTGTYWDSWGSPLQKLLEDMTELECGSEVIGKPCAAFVLMHSVGGKGVLSRLQGILSTFGFLIPPLSGMVYSLLAQNVGHLKTGESHEKDFWNLEDRKPIIENLLEATKIKAKWNAWPVDETDPKRKWVRL